jgi:serine/threonine-protein kinase
VLVGTPLRRPHAYLVDFGLARPIGTGPALTSAGWGTPGFMAPELYDEGHAGNTLSDVYALGVTLFRALGGPRLPLGAVVGAPGTTLTEVLPDRELALALDEVVRRAVAFDPAQRHSSAGELGRAAQAAVARAGRAPTWKGPASTPPAPAGPAYAAPVRDTPVRDAPVRDTPVRGASRPAVVPPSARVDPAPPAAAGVRPRPAPFPPPRRARRGRRAALAAGGLTVAVGVTASVLLTTAGRDTGTAAPAASIVLQPVQDDGSTVRLTWTGPAALDYAVEVTPAGQTGSTVLAGRVTTLTAAVDPTVAYCFRVTATDARTVVRSNVQPVRGAGCPG